MINVGANRGEIAAHATTQNKQGRRRTSGIIGRNDAPGVREDKAALKVNCEEFGITCHAGIHSFDAMLHQARSRQDGHSIGGIEGAPTERRAELAGGSNGFDGARRLGRFHRFEFRCALFQFFCRLDQFLAVSRQSRVARTLAQFLGELAQPSRFVLGSLVHP